MHDWRICDLELERLFVSDLRLCQRVCHSRVKLTFISTLWPVELDETLARLSLNEEDDGSVLACRSVLDSQRHRRLRWASGSGGMI